MQTEIVLPETKPETEWVNGRALQKTSGTYRHSQLQYFFLTELEKWVTGRGRVAPSWRFRVAPPGDVVRPLVPDLAFLSFERVNKQAIEAAQTPLGAPSVAVEILAPDDIASDIDDKITVYLKAGADAVVIVDPMTETIWVESKSGTAHFASGDTFEHESLPEFHLDVSRYFIRAKK